MGIYKNSKIIPILCLIVSAGCSSPHSIMQSWVGHREEELYECWGNPTRIIGKANEGRMAIYTVSKDRNKKSVYCDSKFKSNCIPPNTKQYRKVKIIYISPMGNIYAWKMEDMEKASSEHLL